MNSLLNSIIGFLRNLLKNKFFKWSLVVGLLFAGYIAVQIDREANVWEDTHYPNLGWLFYKAYVPVPEPGVCTEAHRVSCEPIMLQENPKNKDVELQKNKCGECFNYRVTLGNTGNDVKILGIVLKDKYYKKVYKDVIEYGEIFNRLGVFIFWCIFYWLNFIFISVALFAAIYFRMKIKSILWDKDFLLKTALILLIIFLIILIFHGR